MLELFLCLWDQFGSGRSKRSRSVCVALEQAPHGAATAHPFGALRRECRGARNKCKFVWFRGFETAPGSTVLKQTPAFTKSWLWPTASSELYQAEGPGRGIFLKGRFWHKGNVDGNASGLNCLK